MKLTILGISFEISFMKGWDYPYRSYDLHFAVYQEKRNDDDDRRFTIE